jgi:putative ABC transport system substrate-binding protein
VKLFAAFALCLAMHSAIGQPAGMPRIGYLGLSTPQAMAPMLDAFRVGLREHGYVEGKNIVVEYRWADGKYDRVGALAAELVKLKPQLILTQGTDGTRAAKLATTTIPIVMIGVSDPTVTGLVDNIARPSGNITGLIFLTAELNVKRLEFLSQALPQGRKFAVLVNPDNSSHPPILRAVEVSAKKLGLEVQRFEARRAADFPAAFSAMAAARVSGVVVVDDGMFNGNTPALGAEAMKAQIPAAIGVLESAEGGLIAYAVDRAGMYRRAGWYVDKILKGAKPGDLAIERVANYEMVVNRKVADKLGIRLPQNLLLRADRVIE